MEYAVLAVALSAALFAISTNNADADSWGHVQYGRDVLADGRLPVTTTYSYTAEGYPWINHENFAEILMAYAVDRAGATGLMLLKVAGGVLILGLILHRALRDGIGWLTLAAALVVVSTNLTFHISPRPQLFTYVFFAVMLALLAYAFQGWQGAWRLHWGAWGATAPPRYSIRRLRMLWLSVPLFVIWANTHGGFVAGWLVWSAYLTLRGIEAISFRGRQAWGLVLRFAFMVLAAGLATFINPYGPGLHRWLIEAVGRPRPEISEWHAPSLEDPMSCPLWMLLAVIVIVLLMTRRSRDFTQWGVLTLLIWQASRHQRHACFVALAFGFWLLPHLDSVLRRFGLDDFHGRPRGARRKPLVIAGTTVCLLVAVWNAWRTGERLACITVYRDQYPVSAVEYMAARRLEGNLVVNFDWAQYVLAALGAKDIGQRGIRVALDGRFRTCYPQNILDMYFDFALGNFGPALRSRDPRSGPFDDDKILSFAAEPHGAADLVLIGQHQLHARQVMLAHSDAWVKLYQDTTCELWGRRVRFDIPGTPDFIPPAERCLDLRPQQGYAAWPALPGREATPLAGVTR